MSAHIANNPHLETLIENGLKAEGGPYLSLAIQRPRLAGNVQKWDILKKNAVQDIEELLEETFGEHADAPRAWSGRFGDVLDTFDPLANQCGGWLLVAREDGMDVFELQDTPQSAIVWGDTPYLLPVITDGIQRTRGWVLAVGQQQADLFRWDGVMMHDESHRLDYRSYDEMRETREPEGNVNLHTNSALRPNANGGAGGSGAQFHAAGAAVDDYDEVQMKDYLNGVAKAVEPIIAGTGNPLIVAGDPKTAGWTKDLFELHELHDDHIDLAGDSLNADRLAEAAAPMLTAITTEGHELHDMGEGAPLTAAGLSAVDEAANEGRIRTLYLAADVDGFQDSNEDERITFQVLGADTLPLRVNTLVMRTVQAGGEVKVPPTALALTDTEALARLRY
ncbi:hypothetical protein [uncultured Algimonas sp.]|uniref:baeRF3 domain-containing protein n=1 Tax=uncultured Algimonas sp. TaxID=1547920 RepID=UPI00261F0349|nr:hypothetical protein [uncultured Algimonas sp.]